jgi:hypothetical protein
MPVGSLMPNKMAMEDSSSELLPDSSANQGGLFARNRFVSNAYNNEDLDPMKTSKINLPGSMIDSIIILK